MCDPSYLGANFAWPLSPLNPQARLSFDIRSLENPPKHVRDSHNGTSKRLQEWMRQNSTFTVRRDAIASEIQTAMAELLDKQGEHLISKSAESRKIRANEEDELSVLFEPEMRVGINCQMGRHRSVAMVEEPAKVS
ncbi:hypothetical protein HYALB_00007899 [Hymenoscyphus albidus]|uniref:Uncharacterized protein n=1 Tax=Hymenoscyphus albidus TaxID=595503 RepID=A0A9N9LHS2_9HELO|nr:hypothetical protein HYALB_00007899 [Hymenoscyphus albidus]